MITDFGSSLGSILVLGKNEKVIEISMSISTFSALPVIERDVKGKEDLESVIGETDAKFVFGDEGYAESILTFAQEKGYPCVYKPFSVEYDLSSGGLIVKYRVGENFLSVFSVNAERIFVVL